MRLAARVALAGLALAGAGVGVLAWPLVPWMLGLGLAAYGAILWVWPIAWLVLLPALSPLVDLSLWTGWLLVGEQDLLVLVTLAVLLVRAPAPMPTLSRAGWVVLGLMAAATLIGLARGLVVAEPPGGAIWSIFRRGTRCAWPSPGLR